MKILEYTKNLVVRYHCDICGREMEILDCRKVCFSMESEDYIRHIRLNSLVWEGEVCLECQERLFSNVLGVCTT